MCQWRPNTQSQPAAEQPVVCIYDTDINTRPPAMAPARFEDAWTWAHSGAVAGSHGRMKGRLEEWSDAVTKEPERCKLGATGELALRLQNSIHLPRCTPDVHRVLLLESTEKGYFERVWSADPTPVHSVGPLLTRLTLPISEDDCATAKPTQRTSARSHTLGPVGLYCVMINDSR